MEAMSIEILNPKAKALLRNLASMNLITIKKQLSLSEMLASLCRNEALAPSLENITKEVEVVRQARIKQPPKINISKLF